jgi:hypothetical protein
MKREIVIKLSLPRWLKSRRGVVAAALVVGSAATVWATVPNTFASGDVLSAQKLNDNFSYVEGEITTPTLSPRTPSAFHANLTNATSVTGVTTVVFNQVGFDLASEYNPATGTFTAKNGGIYVINCSVYFTSNGTASTWVVELSKNASTFLAYSEIHSSTSTGDVGSITPHATTIVQLNAGDAVTCGASQYTGSAQPLDVSPAARNEFSAARLY